jgi:hypothetical protein
VVNGIVEWVAQRGCSGLCVVRSSSGSVVEQGLRGVQTRVTLRCSGSSSPLMLWSSRCHVPRPKFMLFLGAVDLKG